MNNVFPVPAHTIIMDKALVNGLLLIPFVKRSLIWSNLGAQHQMRAVPCLQPRDATEHRLVGL